ncbi:MAG TPA: efflux RND transporter periplasmic adaptor subunit [Cyclobacteriaceae bacterium]
MKSIFTFGLCICVGSLLISCGHKNEQENINRAAGHAEAIPVKVIPVSSLKWSDDIVATGLLTTENEASYSFKIGGVISKILVDEGQFFSRGQVLAVLNTTEITAGYEQARLSVEKAQRDYDRALHLYKDSVFTLEQLQNTKTGLDIAQKAAEAVAFNKQYAQINAASDGFVTKKIAHEGEVVGPGAPVLTINETKGNSNYVLKVGVTDEEWAAIAVNQKAIVKLDGYPDRSFEAYVFRKSLTSDRATGSFQIELKTKLGDVRPATGMFGRVQIIALQTRSLPIVPYDALIEADGNKAFVFTTAGSNKVKKIPVVISQFDNQKAYISQGLENIREVVISNSSYLNENSIIQIIR